MEEYPYMHPMGRTRFLPRGDPPKMHTVFSPHLSLQRYIAVFDFLRKAVEKDDIRMITEYGPNNCQFYFQSLQIVSWLERINFVDIDAAVMSCSYRNLCDAHWNRTDRERIRKLTAVTYHGNIARSDHRVLNSDVVVGIELIEHLMPADLTEFPQNVFGYIQPKYAIFTTPNREFNVLFDRPHEFRHWDHKFEFTRVECRKWAQQIIRDHPSYRFEIYGIGAPPDGVANVGFASQIIIFERVAEPVPIFGTVESYQLIGEVMVNSGDDRTDDEKYFDKIGKSSTRIVLDLMLNHSIYMRQERCEEGHFMDVVPIKMVVKNLEKRDIFTDVDTVIRALRQYDGIPFRVDMTIALGPVFIDRCDCDGYHLDETSYDQHVPPSPLFYALPSHNLNLRNHFESTELRRYIEQFLHIMADLPEFLLSCTREDGSNDYIKFLTPEVVAAHLKAREHEVDSKTVLDIWREAECEKYPLEKTSFGWVINFSNYSEDWSWPSNPEDSYECDEHPVDDSLCISNLEDDLKCCSIASAEE